MAGCKRSHVDGGQLPMLKQGLGGGSVMGFGRPGRLVSAVPWRTFRVIYESRLELARLLFADFEASVRHIMAQRVADQDGWVAGELPLRETIVWAASVRVRGIPIGSLATRVFWWVMSRAWGCEQAASGKVTRRCCGGLPGVLASALRRPPRPRPTGGHPCRPGHFSTPGGPLRRLSEGADRGPSARAPCHRRSHRSGHRSRSESLASGPRGTRA
jgi:hypothetical protein